MQKVFSLLFNDHPAYKACLDSRTYPDWIDYNLITKRVLTSGERSFCRDTDIERLYHLQQDPSSWYLDCDCIIEKWPDFEMEKDKVYISYTGWAIDTWAILGNNCKWVFDFLIEKYKSFNDEVPEWWSHKLFETELKEHVRPIPNGYIKHLMFHSVVPLVASLKNLNEEDFFLSVDKTGWKFINKLKAIEKEVI